MYVICVIEESSTDLVRFQAYDLGTTGRQKSMCVENGIQVLRSSVKLARDRLLHTTVRRLFPYHINVYDPTSTEYDAFSLNKLKYSTKI
jgi:hypothetical protein